MGIYWSCAQTHPHHEALALRNLRRQAFTAFYPFFIHTNRFRRLVVKPVFPGYVFIELDDTLPNWSPINSTLGVKRLLTHSAGSEDLYRKPAKVPFMDDLRRLRIYHEDAPGEEVIPPGTTVRIRRGPFAEKVALVAMSTQDRVRLLLEAFNREIVVDFDTESVELVRRSVPEDLGRVYSPK